MLHASRACFRQPDTRASLIQHPLCAGAAAVASPTTLCRRGPSSCPSALQTTALRTATPAARPRHQRTRCLQTSQPTASCNSSMVKVGIVGAGFSGLCMAIRLQQAGIQDFTIYEAADDIGGTWRANTYPGCACDVVSVLYSFSFEPFPWTEHYSGQPEILKYLHHCAATYQLWEHIQLNTRITQAAWDEARGVWALTTAAGVQEEVQVLVLAQGPLSIPTIPDVPGLSRFEGPTLHTAAWDSSVQLAGKKVAVVGTGASAIQVIPHLQKAARELVVFQRTPAWVLPRKELMPRFAVPAAQHGNKLSLWLQRQAAFWRNELLIGTALVGNKRKLLKAIEGMSIKHMRSAVSDPQLRQQLTPNYSLGCKRILASDDYYPALAADNVQLVPAGLKQVAADGSTLEAANGESVADVDVLVFATGFDIKAPLGQFDISARGADLNATLEATPEAYLGTAVAGFPNLFTLLGLNTGLGHSSVVFMCECQVNLIIKLLQKELLAKGRLSVEVTQQAQHAFNTRLQQRLQRTVWMSGCQSWYLTTTASSSSNGSTAGAAGSNGLDSSAAGGAKGAASSGSSSSGGVVMWPGLCAEFWWRTLWPVAGDWLSSGKAAQPGAAAATAGGRSGLVVRKDTAMQEQQGSAAGKGAAAHSKDV